MPQGTLRNVTKECCVSTLSSLWVLKKNRHKIDFEFCYKNRIKRQMLPVAAKLLLSELVFVFYLRRCKFANCMLQYLVKFLPTGFELFSAMMQDLTYFKRFFIHSNIKYL